MKQTWVLMPATALLLGCVCHVTHKKERFHLDSKGAFSVFAISYEKSAIITETRRSPIKFQHTVTSSDGSFELLTPPIDQRHEIRLIISRPGYRAAVARRSGGRFRRRSFQVKKATSALEEKTAIFDLERWENGVCRTGKWKKPCEAFSRHVEKRRAYLKRRYPGEKPRPFKVGATRVVADWHKLHPLRVAQQVVATGEEIVVLETYHRDWYTARYHSSDLTFLRKNPHLRRDFNLVVLDREGRVASETELKGTAHRFPVMAAMAGDRVALLDTKGAFRVFSTRTKRLSPPIHLQRFEKPPSTLAVSPSGDAIFVGSSNDLLRQYDGSGRLLHADRLPGFLSVKALAVTPGKECLAWGELRFVSSRAEQRFGDLWATGRQMGVVKVSWVDGRWSESMFALFAAAMWVTDEGVWVFRERLVPDSFHALDPEERRARRLFDDYRHVLYLYSFSGELLRTVDHSRSTCGAPPAQGGSRRGLITKRPLGHIRCRGICRLLH